MEPGRADMVRTAALTYGAQGGLAGRSFAINQMLRRYQAQLDGTFDFRALVLAVGSGQTLMRPPIVTAAQMAFALGDNGQVARETSCIYQITREAQLASAPPNWRSYLVRIWANPHRPIDAVLPRTKQEAAYWNKWVAEGWAQGEKQAVEIYLSDLGRLERDIIGMARYRVLLRAKLVESPKLAFQTKRVDGGRDSLHVGDRPSASPTSRACRAIRAAGNQARGARNDDIPSEARLRGRPAPPGDRAPDARNVRRPAGRSQCRSRAGRGILAGTRTDIGRARD